jgi:hypothetical protein
MSKDKDELNIFDKKKSVYEEVENNIKEDNEEDNEEDNNDYTDLENETLEKNYEEDTLNMIETNFIDYVNKGIPLCEYINIYKIEKFLNKLHEMNN